jgi:hypothetical protein
MAHFAKIENDIVTNVIVIDNTYENDGALFINQTLRLSGEWIQTSYNNNFRANYAGVGYIYDRINDVFYPQQPFPSWVLNTKWQWVPPVPYPIDEEGIFGWNEETLSWDKLR